MENEVRIGVYVCHCGLNIAGTVDVERVREYAATLSSVVVARDYMFICSDPGQGLIENDIKELRLNRVVVASCSPRMHELTFRNVCQRAGLNPYLFEMANIREHCSWVHRNGVATDKARALVRAAVRRVFYHEPLEIKKVPVNPNTLVVGGGIAGIQAALEIADAGHKVYLVERTPSIGGHMIQLAKTFPTLDCPACILTPKMTMVGSHPNIELMTYSEVDEVSGYIGNFKIKIRKKARYVDEGRCNGCGICWEKCPFKVDSEFDVGMGKRKVIYTPFPQAVPNIPVIDKEHCVYFLKDGKCRACEKFCEPGAIDFEQADKIVEVEVGSIIVATGFQQFDPAVISPYGYGKYNNVLTGLEFERLASAGGPTGGEIRLADGREPKSVAILHCVGSRDTNYHKYCSRVCCMYSLKYSHLIKEKGNVDVYQFYIDMRCFGKGYEEFYERLSEEGVIFIRGKAREVTDRAITDDEKGKLVVVGEDTLLGSMIRVPVDMVILSAAVEARSDAEAVARLFNISRSADGFFLERHVKLDPIATPTDGVFIVGCCQGPKDVPDTVAQASAGAARVLVLLSKGEVTLESAVANVDENRCQGCGRCEEMCEFHAPKVSKNGRPLPVSAINEVLCKGCGACAVTCPTGAISVRHFTIQQILAAVEALAEV